MYTFIYLCLLIIVVLPLMSLISDSLSLNCHCCIVYYLVHHIYYGLSENKELNIGETLFKLLLTLRSIRGNVLHSLKLCNVNHFTTCIKDAVWQPIYFFGAGGGGGSLNIHSFITLVSRQRTHISFIHYWCRSER